MIYSAGKNEYNKLLEGQINNQSELASFVINNFPPICHAFGYGSGIFDQDSDNNDITIKRKTRMTDLILVVESARKFHEQLIIRHPNHYSLPCRVGGPKFCCKLQNLFGAGVFFHPFVTLDGKLIKYGVVEKNIIIDDLTDWSSLYLAGRLQKPTLSLIEDKDILKAQEYNNLPGALAAALILLGRDERETNSVEKKHKNQISSGEEKSSSLSILFQCIAGLSYIGDPRLDVGGEDPEKVKKLVHGNKGQLSRFQNLYYPSLERFAKDGLLKLENDHVKWKPENEVALIQKLPLTFQRTTNLTTSLHQIVRGASKSQSMKGLITAGFSKSTRYVLAKLSKGLMKFR